MEAIEMGTVSSRGQICIPNKIRQRMGLKEGSKVMFCLSEGRLIMKKTEDMSFAEITAPLKEAMKKTGLKESDAVDIVHRYRKSKR